MISTILVAVGLAALTYALSGARSPAYLMYFIAFLPFVSLDPELGGLQRVSELGGQNVLFKMSLRLATSAGLLLLLLRRRGAMRHALLPPYWPIVVYVVWAFASLLQLSSPWVSMFRLGELLTFFLIGICLYLQVDRHESPRTVARWHCLALLPLCLATLYVARIRPDLAYHDGLGGIRLGHKFVEANVLGFSACVVMLWATHELRERRLRERHWVLERLLPVVVLLVASGILIFARSRTAMITAVAGQFLLWFPFYRGDAKRRVLFVGFVLFALAAVATHTDDIAEWFLRGDSVVGLVNATGRTELWQALFTEQVPKTPLFGTGYLTLSERGYFEHAGTWWTNAHNTYLFALVSTGIPGLLAVLAIAYLPLRATFKRIFHADSTDRSSWVLLFALQAVVVITGITGFGITGFPNAAMLFSYALYPYCTAHAASAPAHRRRVARIRQPRPDSPATAETPFPGLPGRAAPAPRHP